MDEIDEWMKAWLESGMRIGGPPCSLSGKVRGDLDVVNDDEWLVWIRIPN